MATRLLTPTLGQFVVSVCILFLSIIHSHYKAHANMLSVISVVQVVSIHFLHFLPVRSVRLAELFALFRSIQSGRIQIRSGNGVCLFFSGFHLLRFVCRLPFYDLVVSIVYLFPHQPTVFGAIHRIWTRRMNRARLPH